ncbi:MAG: DegT/DnrJ/EryC1/StrS family aminotransferase, partial [Bacteroidota bacterium]|nr:DegT/DnrJ/EryC1/StrS family aminotransferase [Bacteroidota bacterium]
LFRSPSCSNRKEIQDGLRAQGIPTAVYYPTPLSSQPAFQTSATTVEGGTPQAHDVSERILALPMHTELTPGMQERVIAELFRLLPST